MPASTSGSIANVGTASRPDDSAIVSNNNVNYQIRIDVEGDDSLTKPNMSGSSVFPLVANLPERFHMEMSSQWATPFSGGTASGVAGGVAGAVLGQNAGNIVGQAVEVGTAAAGIGNRARSQNVQTWDSSSPLNLNVDLIFYAQESTQREIRDRQLALLKLVAPGTAGPGGEILVAPGPRLLSSSALGLSEGRKITVRIGRYLLLQNVLITSVGTDVVTLMDDNGIPIAMTVNVSFTTWNATVTSDDLEKMFNSGQPWPSN